MFSDAILNWIQGPEHKTWIPNNPSQFCLAEVDWTRAEVQMEIQNYKIIMNILSIDLGKKKTGLAVYREGMVLGAGVIEGWSQWDLMLETIDKQLYDHAIDKIVIGVPKSQSGQAEKQYRQLGEKISRRTGLKVEYIDETLTSVAANNQFVPLRKVAQRGSLQGEKQRGKDDEQAAKIILQDYLANQNITN